mmetsp:Transcript_2766/g.5489  ORF Transcript_2766/g.5489 Transcript_2766/m.5489 type:complete len:222 (-) Transcript_2766:316-981(-)
MMLLSKKPPPQAPKESSTWASFQALSIIQGGESAVDTSTRIAESSLAGVSGTCTIPATTMQFNLATSFCNSAFFRWSSLYRANVSDSFAMQTYTVARAARVSAFQNSTLTSGSSISKHWARFRASTSRSSPRVYFSICDISRATCASGVSTNVPGPNSSASANSLRSSIQLLSASLARSPLLSGRATHSESGFVVGIPNRLNARVSVLMSSIKERAGVFWE